MDQRETLTAVIRGVAHYIRHGEVAAFDDHAILEEHDDNFVLRLADGTRVLLAASVVEDGPGDYRVAVYYCGDTEGDHRYVGTWTGRAESAQAARAAARAVFEDVRIDGWWTRILGKDEDAGAGG